MAYLMTGSRGVAEELTHDTFAAMAPRLAEINAPYAYARQAVINRARSWHRRRTVESRHRPRGVDVVVDEPDEMWDQLQMLDGRYRAAIVLRYYEGLPDEEIAALLDCAQPTVRTWVRRGLDELRRGLGR